MKRRSVSSSNIKSVGYDENEGILEVEFKSGTVYQYSGVGEMYHRHLMSASSVGGYFAQHIKDQFPTKKL